MFDANTQLQVSETDYDTLRTSFKNFIQTKTEFTDYNFEGSTLTQVLNILAYHSYFNSFYTNMAVNESFLDTAQLRPNLVSKAKELGYLPKSANSSKATLLLNFAPTAYTPEIIVPVGARFKAVKDSVNYYFQTIAEYSAKENIGDYLVEVDVYEGTPITQTFTYSTSVNFYEILNSNIDVDTLIVNVRENANSTQVTRYTVVNDITEVSAISEIFFLQENYRERFEMYFGDGVLGKQLQAGNIIEISYVTCNAAAANDIRSFDAVGYAGINNDGSISYAPSSIITVSPSHDGFEKEGVDSIRFNSKWYNNVQNRYVTKYDYLHVLKNDYPFIESIQVWGGQEHVPPVYGKVIISVKPTDGYVLADATKNDMIAALKAKNVLTIEPIFIDPTYLYVSPSIKVTFDSRKTVLDRNGLFSKIQTKIQGYETQYLSDFNMFFQYSTFTGIIDNADASIISSETSLLLEKRFVPIIDSNLSYKISFTNQLRAPYSGYQGCITSTSFKTNTSDQMLYFDDDGVGNIRMYYNNAQNAKVYINNSAGTVNYLTGELSIKGVRFTFLTNDEISIYAQPQNLNFSPLRNQILQLSNPNLSLFDINTNQLVKSGILDVNGNVTLISSNAIDLPVLF